MGAWGVLHPKSLRIAIGVAPLVALLAALVPAIGASAASSPGQVITVEAATACSQTAVLRTWMRTASGRYVQVFPTDVAFVGVNGVRATREGLGRTPVGVFTLTRGVRQSARQRYATALHVRRSAGLVGRESRLASVQPARREHRVAGWQFGESL